MADEDAKPSAWPEATVQIARIAAGAGVAVTLALTGVVSGPAALAAVVLGMAPGGARLLAGLFHRAEPKAGGEKPRK